MKLYLVTSSNDYYPCSGVEDWEEIFRNIRDALSYVGKLIESKTTNERTCIVEIDSSNLSYKVITEISSVDS